MFVNGSQYSSGDFAAASNYPNMRIATTLELKSGDIIDVRFLNEQTTRDPLVHVGGVTAIRTNQLCIEYIP